MGNKDSKFRVVCGGLPDVMCDTIRYARQVRDGHGPGRCYVEHNIGGEWVKCE